MPPVNVEISLAGIDLQVNFVAFGWGDYIYISIKICLVRINLFNQTDLSDRLKDINIL